MSCMEVGALPSPLSVPCLLLFIRGQRRGHLLSEACFYCSEEVHASIHPSPSLSIHEVSRSGKDKRV